MYNIYKHRLIYIFLNTYKIYTNIDKYILYIQGVPKKIRKMYFFNTLKTCFSSRSDILILSF